MGYVYVLLLIQKHCNVHTSDCVWRLVFRKQVALTTMHGHGWDYDSTSGLFCMKTSIRTIKRCYPEILQNMIKIWFRSTYATYQGKFLKWQRNILIV